jgi:hypothetical protein
VTIARHGASIATAECRAVAVDLVLMNHEWVALGQRSTLCGGTSEENELVRP